MLLAMTAWNSISTNFRHAASKMAFSTFCEFIILGPLQDPRGDKHRLIGKDAAQPLQFGQRPRSRDRPFQDLTGLYCYLGRQCRKG